MATKNIVVLDLPANSPDLNIIEHLWPRLKEAVGKHLRDSIEKPTKATLEQFIRTSWNRMLHNRHLEQSVCKYAFTSCKLYCQ